MGLCGGETEPALGVPSTSRSPHLKLKLQSFLSLNSRLCEILELEKLNCEH